MTFPAHVRKLFPHKDHAPLRALIVSLARDGGDIRPARTAIPSWDHADQITFNQLVAWIDHARTSTLASLH